MEDTIRACCYLREAVMEETISANMLPERGMMLPKRGCDGGHNQGMLLPKRGCDGGNNQRKYVT